MSHLISYMVGSAPQCVLTEIDLALPNEPSMAYSKAGSFSDSAPLWAQAANILTILNDHPDVPFVASWRMTTDDEPGSSVEQAYMDLDMALTYSHRVRDEVRQLVAFDGKYKFKYQIPSSKSVLIIIFLEPDL